MNPEINKRLRSNIDLDIHNTTVPSSDWMERNEHGTERDGIRGDDSSLPVCSVSCTVHLQLFTRGRIVLYLCAQLAVLYTYNCLPGERIVLYLCAQLAVLYTYNCLLILIYYRVSQ